jgi:hypothetical protein
MKRRTTYYVNLPDERGDAGPGEIIVTLVSLSIIAICLAVGAIIAFATVAS